jgi:hypothetical protein
MKTIFTFFSLLLMIPTASDAQVIISEVCPTNRFQVPDEDEDYPDWIEIYNAGTEAQNLIGYQLSDDEDPKWTFPDFVLGAGNRVLVFASGKNKGGLGQNKIDHWETAINEGDQWHYFIGTEEPPADWSSISFDEDLWASAPGGFGYADGDDATELPDTTRVVYYRKKFIVTDLVVLDSAIMSMDYDDGFVAYLNGVEIFRSYNMPDGVIDHTTVADPDHEAQLYAGGLPDIFPLSKKQINELLVIGENVLAIEVHGIQPPSSDLTGRTWLHFGLHTADQVYGPNPFFFDALIEINFHTDFKIGFGEKAVLFDPEGSVIDEVDIPYLRPENSIMRLGDTGAWCLTDSITPADYNGNNCLSGYSAKPSISPIAGFYTDEQTITISGTDVRYTTDGSEPEETSDPYTGPFVVTSNTVIRARSFAPGLLAGETASSSYFIGETSDLPVLSISSRHGDLFYDPEGGLAAYDDYNSGRRAPVHLEYFDAEKNLAFAENASLRPVGGYSIAFDQKSMQFSFDEEYGARDDVHYPIFSRDKPGIESYHEFRVRNMDDDWNSTRMRDILANQMTLPTHCASTGYQHMAVYINGEYWGHYGGREVSNEYYVRDNHGAEPDEVDQILSSYFEDEDYLVDEGTGDDFFDMSDFIIQNDMSDSAQFAKAANRIDWENWVDYFAAEMYMGNGDWFSSMYFNNTRMYRATDVRWRYILFDVTFAQGNNVSDDINILYEALANPAQPNRYTDMFNSLLANLEFKRYFINRFADLMNEYWTPEKAAAIADQNATEIATEIHKQSQRWGSVDSLDWRNEVHELKEFHVVRRIYQRDQIQEYFDLNEQVDLTLRVEPEGAGVIHINSIIPQTYPWAGIYFNGNPVTITAVANPGYTFDHWEENLPGGVLPSSFTIDLDPFSEVTAHFTGSAKPVALNVTEINYDSDSTTNSGDWIEIQNNADFAIDLTQYNVYDQDWFNVFPLPAGTILQPGERLVVAEDLDAFGKQHPQVNNVLGSSRIKLDNGGDEVRIADRNRNFVFEAGYDDSLPWPCTPASFGRTLERQPGTTDPSDPASWFDGCMGGSPGDVYSPCDDAVIISEINYNSSDDLDAGDWFEIKNQLTIPVDLSGWTVRDDDDEHIYHIPDGTILQPGRYFVFCESLADFTAQHPTVVQYAGELGFGLGNGGDIVRLYNADHIIQLSVCYDDTDPWITQPDGDGYTLELSDPAGNLNDGTNWFAGCLGGSPGGPYNIDCIPVSVNHPEFEYQVLVYPNPVAEKITLEISTSIEARVVIYDVIGDIVKATSFTGDRLEMDMSALAGGVYMVSVDTDQGNVMIKVIKS